MQVAHDVIVVGLGAMGSATAYELARRGMRVLGLDRFSPPHAFGSSHGETRIIREAYFEHPVYVPMVQRAYELWRELEKESGVTLLRETGGVMIGKPDSDLVEGARNSAELHGLRHEMLTAGEVRKRFPALQSGERHGRSLGTARRCVVSGGVHQRAFGACPTLRCRAPLRRICRALGARRRRRPRVHSARRVPRATTRRDRRRMDSRSFSRSCHFASSDKCCSGLIDATGSQMFAPERCPVHLWQFDGRRFFYGFPNLGNGVKVAFHHGGEITTMDSVRRDVDSAEVEEIRDALRRFVPAADGNLRASTVCLYTNTPDEHFLIDRHPLHPQVLIASACSGHGFKFSPVIGEILSDLVQSKQPRFDLSLFGVAH